MVTPVITALLLVGCSSRPAFTPLPSGAELPTDCATADADHIVTLAAANLDFSAPCIIAAADSPLTIRFTDDEGVPHNVALYDTPDQVNEYFRGDPISGPNRTVDYLIDPIPAGDHFFVCTLHPGDMRGAIYLR